MPHVIIPPSYRGPTGGEGEIPVDGRTVGDCLDRVGERFPGFREQIFDAEGKVHGFVSLFVNGDEVAREAVDTPVGESDRVEILAAIAGG